IYKVVIKVAKKYRIFLPPCEVEMHSEIPLARGLGSSASAIIAGIELVNQFGNLQLSTEEKLTLAVEIRSEERRVGKECRYTRSKRDWSSDVCSSDLYL